MARPWRRYLPTAMLLFLCIGCAAERHLSGPLPEGPVWPAGAEPVRIRYLGSFALPDDLGIRNGLLARIWEVVTGGVDRRLVQPTGIGVGAGGTVYVIDAASQTVKLYDRTRQRFRIFPEDDHPLQVAVRLAVDSRAGRLYVSDAAACGVRILSLAGGGPGELGRGALERPTGIALNRRTDELLVVDSRKAAVFRYDRVTLAFKGRFGSRGNGEGQFNYPTDLAITSQGEILVVDTLNFRVQLFGPDGSFLRSFGTAGDTPGSFSRPRGIAVDSDDNIYVVDALFDNVQIFDRAGRLLLAFGGHGRQAGEFWMPTGISIDATDRIYVADTYNNRVQLFQYLKVGGR